MSANGRAAWVFALAAAAALAAHALILAERQCARLESALGDDFRVVLFLRAGIDDARRAVIQEKLRAMPEVADARYVSPDEGLAAARRDDPDLIDSIALVGGNPLPGAFEIRPAASALPRLADWLDSLSSNDWSDVRWKPAELQAILRARLYGHWLRLVLSSLACAWALLCLGALSSAGRVKPHERARAAAAGSVGGAAGLGFAALACAPLARDGLLWSPPPAWALAAIVAATTALGWSLAGWRAES